jgi:transposase-like protein
MIELQVLRIRGFSALKVVRGYARRAKDVDRMILACFVLGLSTRKGAAALLRILGRPVTPATVSQVSKQLDAAVASFHRRPLNDSYQVLMLDGVVLRRKTGAGGARPAGPGGAGTPPRRQGGHRLSAYQCRERCAIGSSSSAI